MYTNLKDIADIDLITELTNRGYMVIPRETKIAEGMVRPSTTNDRVLSIDDGVYSVLGY